MMAGKAVLKIADLHRMLTHTRSLLQLSRLSKVLPELQSDSQETFCFTR
jgi:hypothetical protein